MREFHVKRFRSRLLIPGLISAVLCSGVALANVPPTSKLLSLSQFGTLKVGDSLKNCPKITKERQSLRGIDRLARFHLYLFSRELPKRCVNLLCGPFAQQVLASGGYLIGGADPAFFHEVGMDVADHQPHGTLLVVTDSQRKVQAIYRDITVWDLPQALQQIH